MISIKKAIEKLATKKANEPELLWENPNPIDTFVGQTLSLNVGEYDHILVELALRVDILASRSNIKYILVKSGKGTDATIIDYSYGGSATIYNRSITTTENSITISGGTFKATNSGSEGGAHNALLVPQRIYGIKSVSGGV